MASLGSDVGGGQNYVNLSRIKWHEIKLWTVNCMSER